MRSSYIENNYGDVFYRMILTYKPRIVVELGILDGYSTFHIAKGLKFVHYFYNERGHLYAYDLFDEYKYNHGNLEAVKQVLKDKEVNEFTTIEKLNAFDVYKQYTKESVDFLHVDLSNTGDTIDIIVEQWTDIVRTQGHIVFEGGTDERDNIEWMMKYNKPSIKEALLSNKKLEYFFWYGTYPKFPGLTVLYKRRDK